MQNIETYGYGKRRKVYDPDYEHVESAKFKEYERLEGEGYDDEIKVQKQRKNVACILMMFVRIRLATNLIGYHLKRYDVA